MPGGASLPGGRSESVASFDSICIRCHPVVTTRDVESARILVTLAARGQNCLFFFIFRSGMPYAAPRGTWSAIWTHGGKSDGTRFRPRDSRPGRDPDLHCGMRNEGVCAGRAPEV